MLLSANHCCVDSVSTHHAGREQTTGSKYQNNKSKKGRIKNVVTTFGITIRHPFQKVQTCPPRIDLVISETGSEFERF